MLALEEMSHEIMEAPEGEWEDSFDGSGLGDPQGGGTATAIVTRPDLSLHLRATDTVPEVGPLRRIVAVRHESGDRLVALLELASPANKDRPASVDAFAAKAVAALASGVHVSVVDGFPPRRHDTPGGLVGAVAIAAGLGDLDPPAGKPLMIGAFEAARRTALYAEPLAVGDEWPALPLFYRRGRYVDVPLAATYAAAWDATPRRWRAVVEG